jgi:hypothetical protein
MNVVENNNIIKKYGLIRTYHFKERYPNDELLNQIILSFDSFMKQYKFKLTSFIEKCNLPNDFIIFYQYFIILAASGYNITNDEKINSNYRTINSFYLNHYNFKDYKKLINSCIEELFEENLKVNSYKFLLYTDDKLEDYENTLNFYNNEISFYIDNTKLRDLITISLNFIKSMNIKLSSTIFNKKLRDIKKLESNYIKNLKIQYNKNRKSKINTYISNYSTLKEKAHKSSKNIGVRNKALLDLKQLKKFQPNTGNTFIKRQFNSLRTKTGMIGENIIYSDTLYDIREKFIKFIELTSQNQLIDFFKNLPKDVIENINKIITTLKLSKSQNKPQLQKSTNIQTQLSKSQNKPQLSKLQNKSQLQNSANIQTSIKI